MRQLAYLNAIINETLCVQPAVQTLQRAPTLGSGGKWLGDQFIPEGTLVTLTRTLHRNPLYFYPMPDKFWPERWLHPSTEEKLTNNPAAFIPFSTGPVNCVGKGLAIATMRAVIALLIQRFDIHLADGYDPLRWEEEFEDMYVFKVPVVLTSRMYFENATVTCSTWLIMLLSRHAYIVLLGHSMSFNANFEGEDIDELKQVLRKSHERRKEDARDRTISAPLVHRTTTFSEFYSQSVDDDKPILLADVFRMLVQVTKCLRRMHLELRQVHGDVSPANMLWHTGKGGKTVYSLNDFDSGYSGRMTENLDENKS